MAEPVLLIVGARANSLGEAIFNAAVDNWNYDNVVTAGISGDEMMALDVTNNEQIRSVMKEVRPDFVVCTVGDNVPCSGSNSYLQATMTDSFRINVIGPMEVLRHFDATHSQSMLERCRRFVAISSNSARIPRTGSVAYCASKAALSMALRVAARERRLDSMKPLVWGYEPGLLDTAMTAQTALNFDGSLHRMPGVGPRGLDPGPLADRILSDLMISGTGMNGCLFPYDAGEL